MPVTSEAPPSARQEPSAGARRWGDLFAIVAIVVAINFITMPAEEYAGDAMSVRIGAAELINNRRLSIPADAATAMGEPGQFFYRNSSGAYYSKYGIANTFIYFAPMMAQKILDGAVTVPAADLIYLNLFNVVLSALSAIYLFVIAQRYAKTRVTLWLFVLGSLYATFWWNYLRAQTFEIYFTLLALGLFYHLSELVNFPAGRKARRHAIAAALCLGILILAKTFYLLLLPILVGALFWKMVFVGRGAVMPVRLGLWFGIIVVASIVLLLWSNWYRFDSAFASGYEQFKAEQPMFGAGNVGPALFGFLFSGRSSIFLHFPLLIFALVGWPAFCRKNRGQAIAILTAILLVLLGVCPYRLWTGAAAYGPRYLLPIAPLAAIPAIYFFDRVRSNAKWKWAGRILIAAILSCSVIAQVAVNSLPFFFRDELQAVLDRSRRYVAGPYFRNRPTPLINIEFMFDVFDRPSAFTSDFARNLNTDELVSLEAIKFETQLNYYWFPKKMSELR